VAIKGSRKVCRKFGHVLSDDNRCRNGSCKKCRNERMFMWRYGITEEEQKSIIQEQGGKCPICDRFFGEYVNPETDHCHNGTINVRGILCHTCNVMIGYAKDNTDVLQRAMQYLRKWNSKLK